MNTTETGRESFAEMRLHVALADAVNREAKVEWEGPDGDVFSGTIRHGVWTEELQLSPADPRDGHVRITTRTGADVTMAWAAAVDLLRDSRMFLD